MSIDDEEFLTAFENGALSYEQWDHQAHVRVAFVYASCHGLDQAIQRMRAGIQSYNAAKNVPDGPEQGFHETTTQAFMRLIHQAIQERGPFRK